MEVDEPGLFEMAAPAATTAARPSARGRKGELWRCTVNAQVTIVDSEALGAELVRAEENGLTIGLFDDDDDEDDGGVAGLDRVGWVLWPTDGLDAALEAGAFDVWEVATEVDAASEVMGSVTWSVSAKLRDVAALRRVAAAAHPDLSVAIDESLAVAWQSAVDLFAPIRVVSGVTWQPGAVEIVHVPARKRRP